MFPDDVRYTEDHEWIREESGEYYVGITSYAAEQLGDVTYVEIPEVGNDVVKGEAVCAVESVKAASDVYAPLAGHISEANDALEDQPELVNKDPYGDGWFFKLENVKVSEYKALMDAAAYEAFVKEQEE
jgi:glycine cleavage system H protein